MRIFVSLHKMSSKYSEGLNNDKHPKQALGDIVFVFDHVTLQLGLPGLFGLSNGHNMMSRYHSVVNGTLTSCCAGA